MEHTNTTFRNRQGIFYRNMAKMVLALLLMTFCYEGIGQNAYYDAKRLYRWGRLNNLDTTKMTDALIIETILNKYFKGDSTLNNIRLVFQNIDNDLTKIFVSNNKPEQILKEIIVFDYSRIRSKTIYSDTATIRQLINTINERSRYSEEIANFDQTLVILNDLFSNWSIYLDSIKINKLDAIMTNSEAFTLAGHGLYVDSIISKQKLNEVGRDSFLKRITSDTSILKGWENIQRIKILQVKAERTKLIQNCENNLLLNFSQLEPQTQGSIVSKSVTPEQIKKMKANLEVMKNSLMAISNEEKGNTTDPVVSTAISDQNFPTQSEIIDALAIYMAKRFKQEVALTFAENFAKYLKENVLARELFPATFSMLLNSDPYAVPKLGSEWRNSVSKDLIGLPDNMVNSTVVKTWLNNDTALYYLADAVLIGTYVAHKYNFTDMVRSIYLKNGFNGNGDTLKGPYMKQALLVSYIINEEMYDTASSRYWLTPEELAKMNAEELGIMASLIYAKYNSDIKLTFNLEKLPNNEELKKMKNKFVDLIALFKQFENSQVAAYVSNKQGGNLKDAFWDFQRIFIDFLLNQIPEKTEKDIRTKAIIRNVRKTFYIYDYVSNKNYGAAINSTLEIMDSVLLTKSPSKHLRTFINNEGVHTIEQISLSTDKFQFSQGKKDELFTHLKMLETAAGLRSFIASKGRLEESDISDLLMAYDLKSTENRAKDLFSGYADLDYLANGKHPGYKYDKCFEQIMENLKDIIFNLIPSNSPLKEKNASISFLNFKSINNSKDYDQLQKYISLSEEAILPKSPELIAQVRKISGFLTDASTAQNSKELSQVVEKYASPSLSYKMTRKSLMSFDLMGYVGVWAGYEASAKEQYFRDAQFAYGLTVPIGVSFSWGHRTHRIKNMDDKIIKRGQEDRLIFLNKKAVPTYLSRSSSTFFVSIIDIMGPFTFRIGDDEANGLPSETSWAQVFAPGIHYNYGFRNSPLTLNAGFQFSPKLRTFDDKPDDPATMLRLQIGLKWEMPLINFYRKQN